jgi:uncharacterized protein
MFVDKTLLKVIACPKCKAVLTINDAEDGLNCNSCNLSYPIKEGIPVLLVDDASKFKKYQSAH